MSDVPLTVSVLKQLLKEQTEEAKKHIHGLETTLKDEIKKSEEQVKQHLEEKLLEVKKDVDELKTDVTVNKQEIKEIRTQNDRESRRRNIVLFKIPEGESSGMHLKQMVKKLILDNCKVDINNHIDRVYRIGRPGPGKVRPILLALTSFDKKIEIFWGKKQHEANLEMADDFSPEVLTARRNLVPALKSLRELGYKDVHLKHDKIFVSGKECDEQMWNELINKKKALTAPQITDQCTYEASGNGTKRKGSVSPKGNDTKRPSPLSFSETTPQQSELCPTKPETSRSYLTFNQKPPPSPISKFLSQKAIADATASSNKADSDLNQTIK